MTGGSASLTWVLEAGVFPSGDCLATGARDAGHGVLSWEDEWWTHGNWPRITGPAVFHGSLGNADRIARELTWRPGAFCNTAAFHCSAWYEGARSFLLNDRWETMSVQALVDGADDVFSRIGDGRTLFVRPDSPLKPFSGRVVARGRLDLAALDHGFYFDDTQLPVLVAPAQRVEQEWRFVVVLGEVIAGSGYLADGRTPLAESPQGDAWAFAAQVARTIPSPDKVYVMDVCAAPSGLRLLELNPFAGADLYACDARAVVDAIAAGLRFF